MRNKDATDGIPLKNVRVCGRCGGRFWALRGVPVTCVHCWHRTTDKHIRTMIEP